MRLAELGCTGLMVSKVGFGCGTGARLMVGEDRDLQHLVVSHALELGINFFDVAPAYGGGSAEANLGRILGGIGSRPVVATKVALGWKDLTSVRTACKRSLEESLKRLHLDRVDLLQLHNHVADHTGEDSPEAPGPKLGIRDVLGEDGVAAALRTLQEEGMTRSIGFTTFRGEMRAIGTIVDEGAFDVMDVEANVLTMEPGDGEADVSAGREWGELIAAARSKEMGVFAIRPFGGGRRNAGNEGSLAQRIDRLVAAGWVDTFGDGALRLAIGIPGVSSVVAGLRTVEQVDRAAVAASRPALDWSDALGAEWQTPDGRGSRVPATARRDLSGPRANA